MLLDFEVRQKVWTGKDVSYRHLRVFGCLAYVHVAKDQRLKLDSKGRPCIILGYGEDLIDKKVIRSWDIVFGAILPAGRQMEAG